MALPDKSSEPLIRPVNGERLPYAFLLAGPVARRTVHSEGSNPAPAVGFIIDEAPRGSGPGRGTPRALGGTGTTEAVG